MDIAETYRRRKDDPVWNTSYPLSPADWQRYRSEGALPFEGEKELSFYIHIPFCRQLCSFCEYMRMPCPDPSLQDAYLGTVLSDIRRFKAAHPGLSLRGLDIGGGTPTALSEGGFQRLMEVYGHAIDGMPLSDDYEPSIEGTFATLSQDKLEAMARSGIRRLSLGIQSTDSEVLRRHHRMGHETAAMQGWMEKAWKAGIGKVNLDLMYGLKGQSPETIGKDLEAIARLQPQQVTLYEIRTNMIAGKDVPEKAVLYQQYRRYFEGLLHLGYKARFGENAFSLDASDRGLSSYLRSRMLEGVSYRGFGIAAQSMSRSGIAYNVGKGGRDLGGLLTLKGYGCADTYLLPKEELASKYIAISAYNGSLSLARVTDILGEDALTAYREEVDFCLGEGLLANDGDRLVITEKGFEHYGAVFSLFYSRP